MEITELLRFINAAHGTSFSVVGKCAGGTRGAYEIADPTGRRAVLKSDPRPSWIAQLRRVVPITEHLRAIGYPTPRIHFVGVAPDGMPYYVQDFALGAPMAALTPDNLDLLLALNDRQANQHVATEQNWSAYVWRVVFAGESGWAATLRGHAPATADLLAAVEALTRRYRDTRLPTADVVHGDFSPDNVLVLDGRVTAVIDFAAAGRGTRAIDLARLLVWSYDDLDASSRQRLHARIRDIAGVAGLTICLAEQILDLIAYTIDHHAPADVAQAVRLGRRLLDELSPAG
ncbi:MAG TPA: aminoglycoside phosphotransferase family protein [Thermomicrobiales bacterium]|nr:aminoglycoside phosphotransferase family protein [Thermomicrobiales bacterium]